MQCGRQPGGENAEKRGVVCPAAQSGEYDGVNNGLYWGRFCWVVAGTFCHDKVQGTFAEKFMACIHCHFFKQVNGEEGGNFILSPRDTEKD